MDDTLSLAQIISVLIVSVISLAFYITVCHKMSDAIREKGYVIQFVGIKCFVLGPVYFSYLACHPDLNARNNAEKALNILCANPSEKEKPLLTLEKSYDNETEVSSNDK